MKEPKSISVPIDQIGVRRKASTTIAVIGNPNSGKSTLFNRLTGLRQTTGNYPGVTVEKHSGIVQLETTAIELIDLPGIFNLGGRSADERIAVDVLLGKVANTPKPSGLLVVLDATRLYQGLYLLEQLLELKLPTAVAVSMADMAQANGVTLDLAALSKKLGGIPICEVVATRGKGLDELRRILARLPALEPVSMPASWPQLSQAAEAIASRSTGAISRAEVIQFLLDPSESCVLQDLPGLDVAELDAIRSELFGDDPPQAVEARRRYLWVREVLQQVTHQAALHVRMEERLKRWLMLPWPATIVFFFIMIMVFQAVFSWATPVMDGIEAVAASLGQLVTAAFGDGAVTSFIADGVIAGVGSVVVFLPQIVILFLFIIVLEDSGYLARAAFLMDRVMRSVGLSGQSVIPLLSSFACAVPAIMATRVIPDRRDRISTILAAPFMTCSARLPIYALLIAAFVPQESVGWFNLQGIVLFGLYLLGIGGGLFTARLLKWTSLRGPQPTFMLALPEFRWPNLQTVAIKLVDRAWAFLKRAGTVIFSVAVIVWFLAYFPRAEVADVQDAPVAASPAVIDATGDSSTVAAAEQMEQSWLGRIGKRVEPLFRPLGWDWRVSSAVIAGFPAREVVVAVMGTLYAVGSEADEATLSEKLRAAQWPDGRLIFTLPMVIGLLVFYAWCLQCAATLATIRRETNSWRWPVFAWCYMTTLGYLGALLIFQVGSRL